MSNSKRRVDKTRTDHAHGQFHVSCGRKTQEYFARQKMTRTPSSLFPSSVTVRLLVLRICQRATKNQLITDDSDLENKLRDIWERVSRGVLQSTFFEWTERLEWVIEYEGEYYINPHELHKNLIDRFREKRGGHDFCYSLYRIDRAYR
jgi:hypothetical protein